MSARTPEQVHAVLEDAFNRADLDAYTDLYEENATLISPPDGTPVHGRTNIRAASRADVALRPAMSSRVDKKVESDGLALTHARWTLVGIDRDGKPVEMGGRAARVTSPARRDVAHRPRRSAQPRVTELRAACVPFAICG